MLGGVAMTDLFLLTAAQMRRIEPYFPLSHGVARVDDRRVISGIVFVIKNGLRWRDAPVDYGPHKTIYNRFVRWSRLGVFNKIFAELARKAGKPSRLMIDATHLKAHRTAASLLKRACPATYRAHQGRPELKAARNMRWSGTSRHHATQRRPDERLQGGCVDDRCSATRQATTRRQGLRRRLVPPGSRRARHHRMHPIKVKPQKADRA